MVTADIQFINAVNEQNYVNDDAKTITVLVLYGFSLSWVLRRIHTVRSFSAE